MKKILLSALFSSLFFVSCKGDKEKETTNQAVENKTSKQVKVTVNATVKKDDIFQFFYNEKV